MGEAKDASADRGGPGDVRAADASEARLRMLIEVAPDGIFVTRAGAILYVNRAGASILGATDPSEIILQPLAQFLAPHELEAGMARLASAQPEGLLPIRVYDVRGSNQKTVTIEATSLAIEWDGAPAVLTFAHDITDRLRMEAQLARADRLAALGALAAGVAHEVNNPLTYVSLGIDSLANLVSAMPDAERAKAHVQLGDMRDGIARVAAIMRDLQTFARDRAEEPLGIADLTSVLCSVKRLVAHEVRRSAELVFDIPPGLPQVRGATLRLEQVFVNLLINAAQAFGSDQRSAVITVRARAHSDNRVVVEVADNGPGIAPEVLARIFEPFFTTKEPGTGTGLGLAISQTIVVAAGGELTVESEPGRGTTFRVTLVAVEKPHSTAPEAVCLR